MRRLAALALVCGLLTTGSARPVPAQTRKEKLDARSAVTLAPAIAPIPAKAASAGEFVDKTGAKHPWRINDAHALIWDNAPYLPVGGAFAPRSFTSDTDAAWLEDVKALETLKARGLRDLIIWPAKPLASVPIASLQRLADYLDANDFNYGLSFGPGLTTPLTGTVVKPGTYRYADTKESLTATWQVPNADSGLFILTDTSNENRIVRGLVVQAQDETISASAEAPADAGKVVALLYPHKSLPVTNNGALPDVWAGYDDYRDTVLHYLGQAKFGKGLRFYLDPLARRIGLAGETDYLVPDSPGFTLEWEGFLTQRYPNVEDLKLAWGLIEGDFKTHREFARLFPLWANDRGVPYLYDPQGRKTTRILHVAQSKWWADFLQCRNESLSYYMNSMATVLKRQVADVPVVYTWTQTHPIFWNTNRDSGFDGLGVVVRSHGSSLTARTLGPAYSEAEQAERTLWCIATEIVGDTDATQARPRPTTQTAALAAPDPSSSAPSSGGYAAKGDLFVTLDQLRRVGVKGFFAQGFQTAPPETNSGATDWLAAPDSLAWLHEYAARLAGEANAARYAPQTLFFPQANPGPARIGMVPGANNVLWLNSYAIGDTLDWWPAYSGYTLQRGSDANSSETVLISLQGRRETHLFAPNAKTVTAFTPEGAPVPVKILNKTMVSVTLDTTPTVFRAGGQRLVPQEAAEDAAKQLTALIESALQQKVTTVDNARGPLERAEYALKQKDFETAYTYSRQSLDDLTSQAAPYIWLEGETPRVHTFSELAANPEASGGGYLRLATPNTNRLGYAARYMFDVPSDGSYAVWLAGTVPGPNTSPIQWRINSEPPQTPADSTMHGPLYLSERFGWMQLGTVALKKGPQQTLTVYVADRAQSGDFNFAIDALMLTTRAFEPNGPVRPLPIDAESMRALLRDRQRRQKFDPVKR